ncbi:hypothetical protein MINTMi198_48440 [Mycobacterium intracellulare M.i.198]|nr:hypothetical protein MINTMi198_48440 [Mycobacterium intracellulare M.i.198]
MDIVLGVSMAPSSIQMVVLQGEYADGATVEEDAIDVTGADDAATVSASDRVISAILGTREGAADAGLELSSIGVTWTDQFEAAALRDALTAHRLDNVMLVSAFLAAAALAQNVGGAMGYERTAVLLVEPDTATLAVVETSDGSIPDVYKQQIRAESYGAAAEQLSGMVAGLEKLEYRPDGLFVVGSGVDVGPLKPALQTTTALDVSVAEEPETALARGAALASANAPLFASSTAALAYAQDPGTGAVDQHSLPEYLYVPFGPDDGDDELAYSAVADEDADSPTVVIERLFLPEESQPQRRPALLIGSGLAVAGISAVLALEIALAIGIRTTGTVALQPTPNQHLIVPTEQAPAPVQASAPEPKISLPAPVAAPKPLNPPVAAPLPAPPPPEAPPVPAAPPVVPVPVVVPPLPVPVPVRIPVPNPVVRPPLFEAPPRVSIPQPARPQPPVQIPQPPTPRRWAAPFRSRRPIKRLPVKAPRPSRALRVTPVAVTCRRRVRVAPAEATCRHPARVVPVAATSRRPGRVAPAEATCRHPARVVPVAATSRRPGRAAPAEATCRHPARVVPVAAMSRRRVRVVPAEATCRRPVLEVAMSRRRVRVVRVAAMSRRPVRAAAYRSLVGRPGRTRRRPRSCARRRTWRRSRSCSWRRTWRRPRSCARRRTWRWPRCAGA